MGQAVVNVRIDQSLKDSFEETCRMLGMNITTAFTIFAKKVAREQRIPFDVSVDPFYSDENIARLRRAVADADAGRHMTVHELLDADTSIVVGRSVERLSVVSSPRSPDAEEDQRSHP